MGLSVHYTTQEINVFWLFLTQLHKAHSTMSLVNNFEKFDWAIVKSSALPNRPGCTPCSPESLPRSWGLVWNVAKCHCSAFQYGLKMKYHVLCLKFTLLAYWPLTSSMKLLANVIIKRFFSFFGACVGLFHLIWVFLLFVVCLHRPIIYWVTGGRKTLCEPRQSCWHQVMHLKWVIAGEWRIITGDLQVCFEITHGLK